MNEAPKPVGVIETDVFCEACGFNLHTRPVWRDERLGILICQCPECGGHQPALMRTTAAMPWLNRLATIGLMIWIGFGLTFAIGLFGLCLGTHAGATELSLRRGYSAANGETVYQGWPQTAGVANVTPMGPPQWVMTDHSNGMNSTVLATDVAYRIRLTRDMARLFENGRGDWGFSTELFAVTIVVALFAAAFVACGCLIAAICWHWRRWRRLAWLALPLLASGLALALTLSDIAGRHRYYDEAPDVPVVGLHLVYVVVAIVATAEIALLALGLAIGRPVARLTIQMFCPPRARQVFAFLWLCDGKTMPPANVLPAR